MPPDVETPPAEPVEATPPADPGQPPAEEGASPPPAPDAESTPAEGEPGETPPETAELPDLPDETVANLIEAYGEKWRDNPRLKQWIADEANQQTQKQLQEAQRRPEADPVIQDLSNRAGQALQRHLDVVAKAEAGEDFDPRDLAAGVVNVQEFAEAMGYRTSVISSERGLEAVVVEGNEGKVPAADDPVHEEVVQARQAYAEAMANAARLRTSGDPRNRQKAPEAEAQARDAFIQEQLRIAYQAGRRAGEKVGMTKDAKAQAARVALAKDNALKEAAAKLAAGRTPELNGNGNGSAKDPTYEQLVKMSDAEIKKLPRDVFLRVTQGGG